MRHKSLEAWLAWLETCHPVEIELGLERTREVAQRLGLLKTGATVITVAGTNGKGSCIATLEALLSKQGCRAGAYTSPHLLRYNERIRLGGEPVSDADICRAFAAIDDARGAVSLSYFEFGTLAALWLFRYFELDYWLLEVGLGGRLDATNIMDADFAAVTSIAIDHQQWLGNDRETIGREKAGIFRAGKPVVCADWQAPQSIISHAEALGCHLSLAGRDFDWHLPDQNKWRLTLTGGMTQTLELPLPQLPLPSVAAALQILALLNKLPTTTVLAPWLKDLHLQGRFQQLQCAGKQLYLDVAHNPAAAEYLAERLENTLTGKLGMLVAMMADKDIEGCLRPLLPHVQHWWLAGLPTLVRAAPPGVLRQALERLKVAADHITECSTVEEAMQQLLMDGALERRNCDSLLVTGSFYTVSAVLQICDQQGNE